MVLSLSGIKYHRYYEEIVFATVQFNFIVYSFVIKRVLEYTYGRSKS